MLATRWRNYFLKLLLNFLCIEDLIVKSRLSW
uniref:Uncharacterized protein n=1 Tax=Rhizophora mucronata TaxID=61149 RepID=A0A2P2PYX4_RHIMU